MTEDVPEELSRKIDEATSLISHFKGAVVALSAGVDSSLVALLAYRALGQSAVAVTGQSDSLAPEELGIATATAKSIGIRHLVLRTRELENPDYYTNPRNRCYFCKETLYSELRRLADSMGFEAILDGTQIDDLGDDRPGMKAANDAGVISPLLKVSFSKTEVREAARRLGLSVWDKPAMPCLSSRIVHGQEITAEKLNMVGTAEYYIKLLTGVKDLRVRYDDGLARVEVPREERKKFFDERVMDQVDEELRRLGFERVSLDMRGYSKSKRSALDSTLALPMANIAS